MLNRHSEKRAITISYDEPEDISFNLENGMQLLVTFTSTFPGFPITKSAEVSQKTYFRLISQKARELDEFTSVASKITAFLCFVMNKIVCLDSISATSNDLRQDVGNGHTAPVPVEVYCPTWPYSKDEPVKSMKLDMLFGFEEKQNRAESLINRWLQNYEQISPAFDLYFLAKAGRLPTLNLQFLTLAQALEAFHGRTSNEEHKLRNRLEIMTEPFVNFMGGENRPKLIDKIKQTTRLSDTP